MNERLVHAMMIPTNWDPTLIDRIAAFRPAYLYGSLPGESTLRSPLDLPPVTEEIIEEQVEQANELGIGFIYVMNATQVGTTELTERGRYAILQRCEWLHGMGAKGIVLSNPFVMEVVRHWYPDLELHVSVLAEVNTVNAARWFDGIGATVIHLAPDVNRSIPLLREIRKAVSCKLSVLVNEGCVFQCPLRRYHASVMSHAAESVAGGYYADYCYYSCSSWKGADPVELIRAPWIRPEDVDRYLDLGVDLVKIAGREKMGDGPASHTDWIVDVATAYAQGRRSDLSELLIALEQPGGIDGSSPRGEFHASIDTGALDGFLDFFEAGHCHRQCYRCGYCGDYARKAITTRGNAPEYVEDLITTIERLKVGDYRSSSAL